jgi:hypothetical protein
MNPITFNEVLKNYKFPKKDEKADWELTFNSFLKDTGSAPIFIWEGPADPGKYHVTSLFSLLREGIYTLPFNRLRLFFRLVVDGASITNKIWLDYTDSKLNFLVELPHWAAFFYVSVDDLEGETFSYSVLDQGLYILPSDKETNTVAFSLLSLIGWFLQEVNCPTNFVASVTPNKKGKTIAWLKARTHYVILNRKHPANTKGLTSGGKVVTTQQSLKRQAHCRRAHTRLLSNPRYKGKVGLRINVRATWVGPKEWEQEGSIYVLK